MQKTRWHLLETKLSVLSVERTKKEATELAAQQRASGLIPSLPQTHPTTPKSPGNQTSRILPCWATLTGNCSACASRTCWRSGWRELCRALCWNMRGWCYCKAKMENNQQHAKQTSEWLLNNPALSRWTKLNRHMGLSRVEVEGRGADFALHGSVYPRTKSYEDEDQLPGSRAQTGQGVRGRLLRPPFHEPLIKANSIWTGHGDCGCPRAASCQRHPHQSLLSAYWLLQSIQ